MSEYLIGCTHLGHANIIRLAKRPFSSVEEMDDAIVTNWNAKVKKQDVVYHLGDFSFGKNSQDKYKSKLNGNIHYIQGNHDPKGWGRDYIELKRYGKRIALFHYLIEEWDGWFRGAFHFHCHTHDSEFKSAERRGNVGVDSINFTPIKLEDAIDLLS